MNWNGLEIPDNPYYQDEWVVIYHADCRDILPLIPDKSIDLVLTDPPWGSGLSMAFNDRFTHAAGNWWRNIDRSYCTRHAPIIGDDVPFDPIFLLQFPKVITWGAQWYASRLPNSGGWLIWDKRHGIEDAKWPMSEAELAWTNLRKAVRIFRHRWFGLVRESERGEHWHPTQKPVALMIWCIQQAEPVGLILDPYMGAGPTLLAAKKLNRHCIGIEIEERYCEIAAKRCSQSVMMLG